MNILLTGISGAGKSAVGKALQGKGFDVIEVDHYKNTAEWRDIRTGEVATYNPGDGYDRIMELHYYLKSEGVLPLLERGAKTEKPYFFDADAQNIQDYYSYFDMMFLLTINRDTAEERLLHRTTGDWGKDPGELKQTLDDLEPYQNMLLTAGAIPIDTTRPLDRIADEILSRTRSSE